MLITNLFSCNNRKSVQFFIPLCMYAFCPVMLSFYYGWNILSSLARALALANRMRKHQHASSHPDPSGGLARSIVLLYFCSLHEKNMPRLARRFQKETKKYEETPDTPSQTQPKLSYPWLTCIPEVNKCWWLFVLEKCSFLLYNSDWLIHHLKVASMKRDVYWEDRQGVHRIWGIVIKLGLRKYGHNLNWRS